MAETLKRQLPYQLTAADTAIFTVPGGGVLKWVINEIVVCNTDTVQRLVTLYHTSGGAGSAADAIASLTPIQAGQVWAFGRGHVYNTGDTLRGLADVTLKVTVTIYYDEVT